MLPEASEIGWILMEMATHPRTSNDVAVSGDSRYVGHHYTFLPILL